MEYIFVLSIFIIISLFCQCVELYKYFLFSLLFYKFAY
ncbi:putative membrane protein [Bacteroides fragilis str. S24L15]|nr:putative membrane protein [Bacteroides fragilis str. S24L15]EYA75208.1 putative membrane protein [Bacteroides fragilis str. S24L26]EYA79528.1 putative membrane protein [Bacteroides fragilis str. S24L34]